MTAKRPGLQWSDGAAGPVLKRDWRKQSACATASPRLFFPIRDQEAGHIRALRISLAKGFCATCPVQGNCLEWALRHGIREGVWGGQDENEREPLHDARDAKLLKAGFKHCRTCGRVKKLSAFQRNHQVRDGYGHQCLGCLTDWGRLEAEAVATGQSTVPLHGQAIAEGAAA